MAADLYWDGFHDTAHPRLYSISHWGQVFLDSTAGNSRVLEVLQVFSRSQRRRVEHLNTDFESFIGSVGVFMILHQSVAIRNAKSQATETTIGASPILNIYDDGGAGAPVDCASAVVGTLLASMNLPADWRSAPANGSASMVGQWSTNAVATGTAKYYRILNSTETTCHEQGDVTATGGGGAMTVDNTTVTAGDLVQVTNYTQTEGNA